MTMWDRYDFEEQIVGILRTLAARDREHHPHMSATFVTPYQVAVEFATQNPGAFQELHAAGWSLGGKAAGTMRSLARYIANQLSRKLRRREPNIVANIQGAFLSNHRMTRLSFTLNHRGRTIESSLISTATNLSIFRFRRRDDDGTEVDGA